MLGEWMTGRDPGTLKSVKYQQQHSGSTAFGVYLLKGEVWGWTPGKEVPRYSWG